MMNHDLPIKVQAYLDDELSPRDAKQVANVLEGHPEAKRLFAELQSTKAALAGNELEARLPETREFYWSKIEQEIRRQEQSAPARWLFPWQTGGRRWAVRVAGFAGAAALFMAIIQLSSNPHGVDEIESTLADMGTFTFRDRSAGITMVWLYDRYDAQFTETKAADILP